MATLEGQSQPSKSVRMMGLSKDTDPGSFVTVPSEISSSVRLRIRLRPIAWASLVTFFSTLAFCAFLTFNYTDYSPETDKITIFYGVFNPCILFDHYPAKIAATVGIGMYVLLNALFAFVMLLYEYTDRKLCKIMRSSVIVMVFLVVNLAFVNVFTTNLYPETNPDRRLHGAHIQTLGNATLISLFEEVTRKTLSDADLQVVLLHTSFYVAWLIAEFFFSIHVARVAPMSGKWSFRATVAWATLLLIGWAGMLLHAASMVIVIIYGDAWINVEQMKSTAQEIIWDATLALQAGLWGWFPIVLYRFMFPIECGISLTFRLVRTSGDDGGIIPERTMVNCFLLVTLIGFFGGAFHSTMTEDKSTRVFQIASVMRSKPYAYFAAPTWLVAVLLCALACGFTLVQRRLRIGYWPPVESVLAMLIVLAHYGSTLLILEQERFTWIFEVIFQLSYISWVVKLNMVRMHSRRDMIFPIAYCLVGFVIIYWSMCGYWYYGYAYLTWLCLYRLAVPTGPQLFVKLSKYSDNAHGEYDIVDSASAEGDDDVVKLF